MKLHPQCIAQLQAALAQSDVLVTPNNRLAAMLRQWFVEGRIATNANELPAILSFDQWFQDRYRLALLSSNITTKQLLSVQEETVLWQRAVAECEQDSDALAPVLPNSIRDAQKAYQLLLDAGIDTASHTSLFDSLPDSRCFIKWQHRFVALCSERGVISQAQLMRELATGHVVVKQRLALVGFEKLTDIQRTLLLAASESQALNNIELMTECSQIAIQPCDSLEHEMQLALNWAVQKKREAPQSRIAIVIKGLAQQRLLVQRFARKTFYDDAQQTRNNQGFDSFNLSMGYSLAATPLIKSLTLLIESITSRLSIENWRFLFASPFLQWGKSQRWQMAHVLAAMEASGETAFALDELASLVEWYKKQKSFFFAGEYQQSMMQEWAAAHAAWVSAIRRDLSRGSSPPERRAPSAWITTVLNAIQPSGWPDIGALNSDEYQQHESFLSALVAFERFDVVVGDCTLKDSCRYFIKFLGERVFQSETLTDPSIEPVQILGLLEASGQCFDAVWVLGMSELDWPQMASPNPFIPIGLQITHKMPAASAEQERDYAEQLTRGFLCAGEEVTFSYPSVIDEMPVNISPLIEQCAERLESVSLNKTLDSTDTLSESAWQSELPPAELMELLHDTQGAPWRLAAINEADDSTSDEKLPVLPGGTSAVTDAINNPLQAYLKHRLRVDVPWPAMAGIQPAERGNIVHAVVEKIWAAAKNSCALRAMEVSALTTLISGHVGVELDFLQTRRYRKLSQQLIDAEHHIATNTILAWLTMDLAMPDAEVVGLEVPVTLVLKQCVIRGRIDKIERRQIDDVMYTFVVDYKTASPGRLYWLNDPTFDPQLPAYVAALRQGGFSSQNNESNAALPVNGLYLSHIKPGYIRHNGYVEFDEKFRAMAGIKAIDDGRTMEELCEHWLTQIQTAVDTLLAGDASVADYHTDSELYACFTRSPFQHSPDTLSGEAQEDEESQWYDR